MSIYTEQEKAVSLWHPITDDDFDIDFSKPVLFFTEETGLVLFHDESSSLYKVWSTHSLGLDDDGICFDVENKRMTEKGKNFCREYFYAYMYLDDQFFDEVNLQKEKTIQEAKSKYERPFLILVFKSGKMIALDHFDFDYEDGQPFAPFLNNPDLYTGIMLHGNTEVVERVINIERNVLTSPFLLLVKNR